MTLIDLASGAGQGLGQEAGDVIQVFAESQAGKTWYANALIGATYNKFRREGRVKKFKWIYDDPEHGNKFDTTGMYGVNIIKGNADDREPSKTIQEVYGRIVTFAESLADDEYGIYLLDSLDAVGSDETAEMSDSFVTAFAKNKIQDKGSFFGEKNKFMSQIFMTNIPSVIQGHVLVVLISQMRDNIGASMYGPKRRVTGGSTVPFLCGNRSFLRKVASIEVDGIEIGARVMYEAKKSRGAMPCRSVIFTEYYSFGMDNLTTNVDYLYDTLTATEHELKGCYETKTKKGEKEKKVERLEWDGKLYTRDELIAYIDKAGLWDELNKRVIQEWVCREKAAASVLEHRVNPMLR